MARKLEVVITGDARGLKRAYGDAETSTRKFGRAVGRVGLLAGGAAVAGLGALAVGLKSSVSAAQESEKVQAALEAQLKASGVSYQENRKAIDDQINSLSKLAGLDDEDLTSGFTRLVRASGDVSKSLEQMSLVADFARARNIEVSNAADIVAKVMNGNVGILSRYGVSVKDGATATEALAAAQAQFAGQAEAYGNTTAGAQDKVRVAIENVQEEIGARLLPAFNKMLLWAADQMPKISAFFDEHGGTIRRVLNGISSFITGTVIPIAQRMFTVFQTQWQAVKKVFEDNGPAIERVVGRVMAVLEALAKTILFLADNVVIPILKPLFTTVIPVAAKVAITAIDGITGAIEATINAVKWLGKNAAAIFEKVRDGISGPAGAIVSMLQPLHNILYAITRFIHTVLDKVAELAEAVSRIGSIAGGIVGKIPGLASGGPVQAGRAYVVGEKGPELFVPGSSGTIVPNLARPGLASGGGAGGLSGGAIVINFPNYVGSHDELVRAVRTGLAEVSRDNPNIFAGRA